MAQKPCRQCGGSKEGARPGAWYCPTCQEDRQPAFLRAQAAREQGECVKCVKGKTCKACATNKRFAYDLKRKYGITVEEYDEMLKLQDYKCAICKKKPRAKRLAVDHNHSTGRVRGLLCSTCNHRLLGGARDSVDVLRAAVYYMEYPTYDSLKETHNGIYDP